MKFPKQFTITSCAIAMDGGTRALTVLGENSQEHCVILGKRILRTAGDIEKPLTGRMYFDDELIPIRSTEEAELLELLRTAKIEVDESEEILRSSAVAIIEFVESDLYLWYAERIKMFQDETRYTVWLTWDARSYLRTLARFRQANGLGMSAARELMELGNPIAADITAVEVADLVEKYADNSMSWRIEPEYPWRLSSFGFRLTPLPHPGNMQ
jgi:hypothetical protein